MRSQFIQIGSLEEAKEEALWAAILIEVDGGYMAFESVEDAVSWEDQV